MLSKISDDIGAILTNDIVNYTRNVVDVNTCKVQMLVEHARSLSYNLDNIRYSYEFFPRHIQCLIDIFSINPEYLFGNEKNHILSDKVIKEILIYIRENGSYKTQFINQDVIDRLIDDPHGLLERDAYRNFIQILFYNCIVDALTMTYSDEDSQPIIFNLLWEEIHDRENIIRRLNEYKSWVDRFILNEIQHPLNAPESNHDPLANTIYEQVERIKNQKKIPEKFNPFQIADWIYFNGLNPNNNLSEDEMELVERVIDYHSKTKYDYERQMFVDNPSTQYAYYRELEFCDYLKMVMFVVNNLNSFDLTELTYDTVHNHFV